MAAFAALTSLKNIIHDLQNHPSPPISIDEEQARSLTEIVSFLQEFVQCYNFPHSTQADPFEIQIANAAYAAQDVIESKINTISEDDLYQDLQLVIEEMDDIMDEAMMIKECCDSVQPDQPRMISPRGVGSSSSSSSVSFSTANNTTTVGIDDVLIEVLESLIGSQLDLQVIPITGMGGIGKTTLARNLFENACVKEHFGIRAWTTISQYYNALQALNELLSQAKGNSSGESEDELGLELYQFLLGRYLIVMDDM